MEKIVYCRVCKSETKKFYDFGMMPLSNNLERYSQQAAIEAERFPLELHRCETCTLIQLSEVVDPEKLYSYYTYRSSMSMTFKKHCHQLAEAIKQRHTVKDRGIICDIAGNDGTLAKIISEHIGGMPLVVDPAGNILKHAQDNGCAIHKAFWGLESATLLLTTEKNVKRFIDGAMIITATNVFAHVDDLDDFTSGVKEYLHPDGMFVCEFPHGLDFITKCQFDTTYFEHLSYMTLTAFAMVMQRHGLEVFEAEKVAIHGGSLRVWVSHIGQREVHHSFYDILEKEMVLHEAEEYRKFREQVGNSVGLLCNRMGGYLNVGKKVVGFGASAKGNILLNMLDSSFLPAYIIDETPEKIGCYSPGTGLKIHSLESEAIQGFMGIEVILILAWNFKDEIEKKLRGLGFEGEIYCPL